jgi:hypothetical protein
MARREGVFFYVNALLAGGKSSIRTSTVNKVLASINFGDNFLLVYLHLLAGRECVLSDPVHLYFWYLCYRLSKPCQGS